MKLRVIQFRVGGLVVLDQFFDPLGIGL